MDPPPVHYVTTSDGYSIAYAVSGEGRPFVLLPGAFEHVQLAWQYPKLQPWLEGLASRFRLIQIDERGAGMSTRGLTEDHAIGHYQRDIEAVIEHLNPAPFVLYAGPPRVVSAVQFAVDHPDRVLALILGPAVVTQPAEPPSFFHALPGENWDVFLRKLVSLYQSPGDIPKSVALLKQAFDQRDFLLRRRARARADPQESLIQLRTPTLVLHPRDYAMSDSSDSMKNAQLARATMTLIDGSFALGDAEQGIRAIESFLAELPEVAFGHGIVSQHPGLSPREVEVLRLVAAGKSNQQIADELVISLNTVRRHVSNIFDKTGATNRAAAAIYARDHGIV